MLPLKIPAAALTISAWSWVISVIIAHGFGRYRSGSKMITFLGAVIGLGIPGTGIAYLLYYNIIDRLGAVRAASATYLPPIVALVIGMSLRMTL